MTKKHLEINQHKLKILHTWHLRSKEHTTNRELTRLAYLTLKIINREIITEGKPSYNMHLNNIKYNKQE